MSLQRDDPWLPARVHGSHAETHTTFQQAKGIFTGAPVSIAAAIPKRVGTRNRIPGQSSKKDRRRC